MRGRLLPVLYGVAVLAWAAVVALNAMTNWPHVPLDMGGKDPVLAAAYERAVTAHVIRAILIAVVPAVVAGLVLHALRRRQRP